MLWGVFQDYRGVLYCEQVDEGIQVWARPNGLSKGDHPFKLTHRIRGKKKLQEPFTEKFCPVLVPELYPEDKYMQSAYYPPEGYVLSHNRRYFKPNRWGHQRVLLFINNDEQGQALCRRLRVLSPERDPELKTPCRVNAKPHPDTSQILVKIKRMSGFISETR